MVAAFVSLLCQEYGFWGIRATHASRSLLQTLLTQLVILQDIHPKFEVISQMENTSQLLYPPSLWRTYWDDYAIAKTNLHLLSVKQNIKLLFLKLNCASFYQLGISQKQIFDGPSHFSLQMTLFSYSTYDGHDQLHSPVDTYSFQQPHVVSDNFSMHSQVIIMSSYIS